MSSSSANDSALALSEKLDTLNIVGTNGTKSLDQGDVTPMASSASQESAPFTPRPSRVDLPSDKAHDTNVRAHAEATQEEGHKSKPYVNPLVHKSSFGYQAEFSPMALASKQLSGSSSRQHQDVEVLKMNREGPSTGANASSTDTPFSPLSQTPTHQLSVQASSTFSQLPIESNGRRGSGKGSIEDQSHESLADTSKQEAEPESATPQKRLPSKSAARVGNTAAISSPAIAKIAHPSTSRSAGASHTRPSRSTNHRPSPQLPSAPNVLPAPPPAMYWSRVPVHGSIPKRSFRAHTANLADEIMWLFGGCDAKGCFREVWCFDTETMCWSKPKITGDLPPPRRAHSATMVDKRLYVFAGGDGPHYFNDLYVFDTVSLRWTKPDVYGQPPSPRRAHTSNYHNGQLIIFGGGNGVGALNDVFTLDLSDPNRLEWRRVECRGKIPIGRGYHTSNLVDGKLIVIGGSDGHMSFNDIHVLRLDTRMWYQVKTDEIHNRLGHTATQVGSYLFIVGGHDSHAYTQEILTLNLVNLQWEPRRVSGQKPPGRGYHQAWLRDSRLFVHGGFDGKEIYDDLHYVDLAACAYLPQITSFNVEVSFHPVAKLD
jgi:hypothetical protein